MEFGPKLRVPIAEVNRHPRPPPRAGAKGPSRRFSFQQPRTGSGCAFR